MNAVQEKIQQGVIEAGDLFRTQGHSCIICGSDFDMVGLYVPSDQTEHEAPEGKMRVFFYPACTQCAGDKKSMKIVESYFLSNFKTLN